MSPLMQQTLENKKDRRRRLMALPYPEKVRIVEQMRSAAAEIRNQGPARDPVLREEPTASRANESGLLEGPALSGPTLSRRTTFRNRFA
jgi:hypothetical protein